MLFGCKNTVALLAEGVDRNTLAFSFLLLIEAVALLAEGVDRNPLVVNKAIFVTVGRPPRGGRG